MKNSLKLFLFTILLMAITPVFGQGSEVEMADTLRADGKIYVVVLVLSIIFVGIVAYMIWIDRKLSRLENHMKK